MNRRSFLEAVVGGFVSLPFASMGRVLYDERSRRIEGWYEQLNRPRVRVDYIKRHRKMMRFWPSIKEKCENYGWDPFVLAAQMCVESGGHQYAHSVADARGLMQILPTTAREVCGPVSLWQSGSNIDCALQVLLHHYLRTHSCFPHISSAEKVDIALGCYFHGGSLIEKIQRRGLDSLWDLSLREGIPQTLEYVPKIRALELAFKGRRPRRRYEDDAQTYSNSNKDLIHAFARFQIPIPNEDALHQIWPGQRFAAKRKRCRKDEEGDVKCYHAEHGGLDLTAITGTPVYPMIVGRVVRVEPDAGNAGNYVSVESTLYYTPDVTGRGAGHVPIRCDYMHLDQMVAKVGDIVDFNSHLGTVGRTGVKRSGAHLHLQVYDEKRRMIDPLKLLRAGHYIGQALRDPGAYLPLFEELAQLDKEKRHRQSS